MKKVKEIMTTQEKIRNKEILIYEAEKKILRLEREISELEKLEEIK